MEIRPFHAFRTWKVHVVISLFMLLILTHCSRPSASGMSNYRQIIVLFAESELWLSLCADCTDVTLSQSEHHYSRHTPEPYIKHKYIYIYIYIYISDK